MKAWLLAGLLASGIASATNETRVVALDVSAVDTLVALGVEPVGTVQPLFVSYLDVKAEKAGSLFEPDFEVINRLQPDLIVTGPRMTHHVSMLESMASVQTVGLTDNAFTGAIALINSLASVTQTNDQAKVLVAGLQSQRDSIAERAPNAGRTLVVMTNGPKISVYGEKGRFGWIHTELGFLPADASIEDSAHGQIASFEYIQQVNPDLLIVIDRLAAVGRPGDAAAVTLDNPLVAKTTAWKTGKVVYLNAANAYIANEGATALGQVLSDLSEEL